MMKKKKKSLSSIDIVGPETIEIHLQEEIMMDILCKLRVQSLVRFKCVSKFWNTLICDDYFNLKHLNYAKNDPDSQKFLICQTDPILSFYSCPFQQTEDVHKLDCSLNYTPLGCKIYSSCNGLVFLILTDGIKAQYLLWNPSTRESILLPRPEFLMKGCMCGLAYDEVSDGYTILKIDGNVVDRQLSNEILVLKNGSWKRIGKPSIRSIPMPSFSVASCRDCLAFVHGAFHWLGLSQYYTIFSFDISNEVYGEIPLLERMCNEFKIKYFEYEVSIFEGLLCFYSTTNYQGEGTFNLWVMTDYGVKESWTNLYTIRDIDLLSARPRYTFADGELLLSFRYLNRISLSPIFRTSKGSYFGLWPQCGSSKEGFAYTESLISPKLLI